MKNHRTNNKQLAIVITMKFKILIQNNLKNSFKINLDKVNKKVT